MEIKQNSFDSVDWVLSEVFSGKSIKSFKVEGFENIKNESTTDECAIFVYNIEGKNIMVRYSDPERHRWRTIEFYYVEPKMILVPTLTWKIIKE